MGKSTTGRHRGKQGSVSIFSAWYDNAGPFGEIFFFFFCFVTSVVFRIFFFPFSNVLSFVKLKFKTYLAGLAINSFLENQVLTQLQRVEILSEMKISYTL